MSNRAGTLATPEDLVNIDELLAAYRERTPDLTDPAQRVAFGTSGHRGSSLKSSFNDAHIAAISQAIAEYRKSQGITGPLFMGKDTHALSGPAQDTALEVLAANGVTVLLDSAQGFVPTPALSRAIIVYNADPAHTEQADGIVITPSHNPPADGGFKYNPPHGGPAGSDATGWIANRDKYDIATGNDADSDRHGIVTPDAGLMNPNHYLAVAIDYLYTHRDGWAADAGIGKTLVSSSMIDRVATALGRKLVEVPVGFKYFVDGLSTGTIGFGGEESAGASFLMRDGSVWTTDKDGIILALLAAEIIAVTGKTPSQRYAELAAEYGAPAYARVDAAASREQKAKLSKLSPADVTASELAGETITAKLTEAPGNGAAIGGLKVTTENAWFAARPSGTEDVYKIYAESFLGADHLAQVQAEAKKLVDGVIA